MFLVSCGFQISYLKRCSSDYVATTAISCIVLRILAGVVYAWGMGTNNQLGQTGDDDLWLPAVLTGKQFKDT